jgi:hypothetical protein
MVAILRSTGRIRGSKIDRLERAYRQEREKMTTSTGRQKSSFNPEAP